MSATFRNGNLDNAGCDSIGATPWERFKAAFGVGRNRMSATDWHAATMAYIDETDSENKRRMEKQYIEHHDVDDTWF